MTRNRSQWMFCARRFSMEMRVGRMIQRMTREMMMGLRLDDFRVERNVERGFGVVGCRARRWSVQRGMVAS
jgi:hypothetical protein